MGNSKYATIAVAATIHAAIAADAAVALAKLYKMTAAAMNAAVLAK
ncbi:MAG: hypothetical protein FWG30_03705 [Eubacteriaceae bacterium]|nr:hypothetical protein [Eubacteriaceae bacterium]